MKDKDFSALLKLESTAVNSEHKAKTLKASLEVAENRIDAIDFWAFLKNQIHFISRSYYIYSIAYTLLLPLISAMFSASTTVLLIGILTPFLAMLSVPNILCTLESNMIELESSCLYRPNSVFSARMVICSAINLVVVVLTSAVSGIFAGSFGYIMALDTMLLCVSTLISMLLSLTVRNRYTPFICEAVMASSVTALVARVDSLYVHTTIAVFQEYLGINTVLITGGVAFAVVIVLSKVLSKKLAFSGGLFHEN